MPVLGVVLHLDPTCSQPLVERLGRDPRVELGPRVANKLPIVVDTPTRAQDKAFWKQLEQQPAVLHTELVFSDFSDLTNPAPAQVNP